MAAVKKNLASKNDSKDKSNDRNGMLNEWSKKMTTQ